MSKSLPRLRKLIFAALVGTLGYSCASGNVDEKIEDPVQVKNGGESPGSQIEFETSNKLPFPKLIDEVTENYNSGPSQVSLALRRSWDIDRDGDVDMVEIWNQNGSLLYRVCDFDGDGDPESVIQGNEAH